MKKQLERLRLFDKENPFLYYIAVLFSAYGIWKLYKAFIYPSSEGLLALGDTLNIAGGKIYIFFMTAFLKVFSIPFRTGWTEASYGTFPYIALEDAGGVYVAYHCLGYTALFLFNAYIWFSMGSWKRKVLWSIAGSAMLFVINWLRMLVLLFLDKHVSGVWFEVNHSLIFVILMYTSLFLIHLWYMKPKLKAS